ncbi:hypothetical protein [Flavitalea sp.]|nr:hypothetical protein [Flavitalea sp.]
MKHRVISICCLVTIFSPIIGLSQQTFISLGGEIAIPNSYGLNMVAGTLTGGSLRIESSFGKHIAGLATIGYLFSSKQHPFPSVPTTTSTYKVLPLQVGIKYYTKEKGVVRKGLFFSGELGLLFTTTNFTFASNPDDKRKETDLGFAPGIGYLIGKIEPSFRLQFDLSDSGFNVYYYNFRVAYAFIKNSKSR